MSDIENKKFFEKITLALQSAAKKVWLEHKLKGLPIVVSDKNGNIRYIPPEEINVELFDQNSL